MDGQRAGSGHVRRSGENNSEQHTAYELSVQLTRRKEEGETENER